MSTQQDKVFVRTFIGVIAVLVGITIFLIILATRTGLSPEAEQERQALAQSRAQERLQPVYGVRLSGEPMPASVQAAAPAAAAPMSPEQVVQTVCAGCHTAGVMGAPRLVAADWQARLGKGLDTLVNNAITGIGGMPAKGGNPNLSDEDVRAAVVEMLKQAGVQAK